MMTEFATDIPALPYHCVGKAAHVADVYRQLAIRQKLNMADLIKGTRLTKEELEVVFAGRWKAVQGASRELFEFFDEDPRRLFSGNAYQSWCKTRRLVLEGQADATNGF